MQAAPRTQAPQAAPAVAQAPTPPQVAPTPKSPPPEQVAALPPPGPAGEIPLVRIEFIAGSAELTEAARQALARRVADVKRDQEARVQVLAYATGNAPSDARRLSLSRALSVRAFFVDQGIASTRIDVRALGEQAGSGPGERADVMMIRR